MIIDSACPHSAVTKSRSLDSIGWWRFGRAFGDDNAERERGFQASAGDVEVLGALGASSMASCMRLLSETGFDAFVDWAPKLGALPSPPPRRYFRIQMIHGFAGSIVSRASPGAVRIRCPLREFL